MNPGDPAPIPPDLLPVQRQLADAPLDSRLFVSGPAGTGKTTAGAARLRSLLARGVPGGSILVLAPQRSLQGPYVDALQAPDAAPGGEVVPATVGGLARRMCDLFWPLAAGPAGFAHPDQPPVFLTLETAQYYMAHLVRPLLDQGWFESVTIDRNRLYSQIIDNLNKSAVIGFPHGEIGARLDSAYFGEPAQRRVYADAQECASRFRRYCLDHNLLDFSLQFEIFSEILWPQAIVRDHLRRTFRHLIYDNLEEDGPRAHGLVAQWLPDFDSALLLYDEGAGYRRFLGADVNTGLALGSLCQERIRLEGSFIMSDSIAALDANLAAAILPEKVPGFEPQPYDPQTFEVIQCRYYPQLLDSVAAQTRRLLDAGLLPSDIVILAPYLSDALRFSLTHRLETLGIPWRSHRPSRSLNDEPASRALLTLAMLAHPQWGDRPPKFDLVSMLMKVIQGLDLVRAQLLADAVVRPDGLLPFDSVRPALQERITYGVGARYAVLLAWLTNYSASESLPLDHFLRRVFGEVLSQPGFGYHEDFDAVRVAASLVESVKKFRQALEPVQEAQGGDLGREYIRLLQDGVIAASYVEAWEGGDGEAVLIAPAHSFLMMNRPAAVQFWLDPGSSGWYQRLAQPLTHPYVLSRDWRSDQVWSDADEVRASQESMARLVSGLLHRCRERIVLGLAELGETGYEQRGELLRAFQKVIQASEAN